MDTLLIEVTNQNAYGMLKELENLHMIKVLKSTPSGEKRLSERFRGKLPKTEADELQAYIKQSREEWDM